MNKKQKRVLIAVALVVLGMLVYPPWHFTSNEIVVSQGYSYLFNSHSMATVDTGLLITQWIAVLIIGGISYFILKDR